LIAIAALPVLGKVTGCDAVPIGEARVKFVNAKITPTDAQPPLRGDDASVWPKVDGARSRPRHCRIR
jgi:hypothetical protein